jgi:hypothetical protein
VDSGGPLQLQLGLECPLQLQVCLGRQLKVGLERPPQLDSERHLVGYLAPLLRRLLLECQELLDSVLRVPVLLEQDSLAIRHPRSLEASLHSRLNLPLAMQQLVRIIRSHHLLHHRQHLCRTMPTLFLQLKLKLLLNK